MIKYLSTWSNYELKVEQYIVWITVGKSLTVASSYVALNLRMISIFLKGCKNKTKKEGEKTIYSLRGLNHVFAGPLQKEIADPQFASLYLKGHWQRGVRDKQRIRMQGVELRFYIKKLTCWCLQMTYSITHLVYLWMNLVVINLNNYLNISRFMLSEHNSLVDTVH